MQIKIYIYPKDMVNSYTSQFKSIFDFLGATSFLEKSYFLKNFFKKKNGTEILYLNWIENRCYQNGYLSIFKTTKTFLTLLLFRFKFDTIIYCRHNIYPHNLKGSKFISLKIIQFIELISDKKISHSPLLAPDYKYVPHPLYRYPILKKKRVSDYYIIFGRIERYKNL